MSGILDVRVWGALLAAGALLALGYEARTWVEPTPEAPAPDTVVKERQITKTDTVTETVPETVIRYDTVRTTDTVEVPVPSNFNVKGLIEPQPVDVSGQEVTLTYFDPQAGRYTQNVYAVPPDRYRFRLYAVGLRQWQPAMYQVGLGAEAYLNPKWLPFAIEPFAEARVGRHLVLSTGLRWHIAQL